MMNPAGLDPEAAEDMYRLISRLNRDGKTVIMITHDIPAAMLGTHILEIGKSGFFGTADEYTRREKMAEALKNLQALFQLSVCAVRAYCGSFNCRLFFAARVTLVLKRFSFIGDGLPMWLSAQWRLRRCLNLQTKP
ncbi:MAG: hypothetical protein ACLR56_01870 [Oscillospiraceae bacterium]